MNSPTDGSVRVNTEEESCTDRVGCHFDLLFSLCGLILPLCLSYYSRWRFIGALCKARLNYSKLHHLKPQRPNEFKHRQKDQTKRSRLQNICPSSNCNRLILTLVFHLFVRPPLIILCCSVRSTLKFVYDIY